MTETEKSTVGPILQFPTQVVNPGSIPNQSERCSWP